MRTLTEQMQLGTPMVFGHRGAKWYAPMNTIPAFQLAAEQGANGVELDVRLTADGEIVILHDAEVNATSNGQGRIDLMTLAQARALDFGGWFAPAFAGTGIPTLAEVFEALKSPSLYINVEIKSEGQGDIGLEQKTADCIAQHQMADRVIVSSFDVECLRRFAAIMPAVPRGLLTEVGQADSPADVDVAAIHPFCLDITAALVERARQQHRFVNTWTVNDPDEARRLAALGVITLITDRPDTILAALGR